MDIAATFQPALAEIVHDIVAEVVTEVMVLAQPVPNELVCVHWLVPPPNPVTSFPPSSLPNPNNNSPELLTMPDTIGAVPEPTAFDTARFGVVVSTPDRAIIPMTDSRL
jgi:hypothetical protein